MRFVALFLFVSWASAAEAQRTIAITFDDLPANCTCSDLDSWRDLTEGLVRALAEQRIPAIGFVNEVKLDPEGNGVADSARVVLLERWLEAGLELGNHTYSHPDLHRLELADFQRNVLAGEQITRQLLRAHEARPRYFRHPFLHTGRDLDTKRSFERFLEQHGYRVAPVTIDNSEWIFARAYDIALDAENRDLAARLVASYLEYMESKIRYYELQSQDLLGYELPQVLLLHANRLNAHSLGSLAGMIRDRGYRFVSLTAALEDPAYRRKDDFTGAGGISWLQRWAIAEGKGRDYFRGEPEAPSWVMEAAGIDQE